MAIHGFVGEDSRAAKATYLAHEARMFRTASAEIGRPMRAPPGRERDVQPGGVVFAGGPDEVAGSIPHLHERPGHSRQTLQMGAGGLRHATFPEAIELLGTKVLPQFERSSGSPRLTDAAVMRAIA